MKLSIDKIKVYLLEIILLVFLFFTLFISNIYRTIYLAVVLFVYSLIVKKIIKKKNIIFYNKKEINIILMLFAIAYLACFYISGIFFGYNSTSLQFGITAIKYFILPLSVIIFSTETIRETFLSYKDNFSKFLIFIITVLIDLIIYTEVYDIYKLDDFLMILGFVFFASISSNLLYNYVVSRFGKIGVILYRLVTTLYIYFIPVIPNVYIFFRTFIRMVYPYFIYLFLENVYSSNDKILSYKDKRRDTITISVLMFILVNIIMLVSCQFKYGILVVGSGSMTGTLNIGDATIFKKYNKETIKKGDIIIFEKDGLQIIHRVVDITSINGEVRYYTKGDANKDIDDGYINKKDIKGISKIRIKYIGYPSIWLKHVF